MTVNELLAYDVVDAAGDVLGQVHDVVVVRRRESPPEFELRYLMFQPGSVGARLGYIYPDVRGPWPLAPLMRRLAHRIGHAVEWKNVTSIRDGRIYLDVTAKELPSAVELVEQR